MTLISYRYKFIFLANMKCGSTTIHKYLQKYADEVYIRSIYQKPISSHAPAIKVKRYIENKGHKWRDFFIFTTVRNPFDRIRSCYYYEKQKRRKLPSFRDYVMKDRFLKEHFRPLESFAYHDGRMLVHKIIKLEDIRKELPSVLKKLKIPLRLKEICTFNKSKKPYKLIYTPEMRKYLRLKLKKDFKFYA